ncbi:exodeoxyribonuclease V subunit gamma [Mycobacterium sp. CVI_P3]|uniref:RecBCD enzyme subunit RecC n=1 Tax=Mycobacterium pinniadriaticum TaxID=2994102 RepID=A0ABT3S8S3_9MYCO|nr:exodeoxyribonuclease V subunit gamma [Mycobacterium pinniadriaticum]MCX2929123.1 exodeoxyribonuclease V subunit gamma [Mycobacterium pinniadriaticum]MCX2935548.1 exodeoxyribonuclease V subunit gamma [Mycobacterium pinniadriaticum]
MALHLHRAERTDLLADGLGTLLATPQSDPFAEELVVVPARGVERWLSQRLSHILGGTDSGGGVCAGVSFRSPASLIGEIAGTAEADPWSADAMTWPLLEVVDASLDEPWCRTLATHLGHFESGEEKELRQGRRYAVARRLAGLFASYARQRPQLLVDWLGDDPSGLDTDLRWQPPLWRALVERVGAEPPSIRHAKTVALLRTSGTDLPARLSLFGHTRLPSTDVELIDALAEHHDVHLWLPHPSAELWSALAGLHGAVARSEDTSHRLAAHPLLATLGRDVRELQRSLPAAATDEFLASERAPDTLLGFLQSDISANAIRPQGRSVAPEDRSVQVHSCHGPARQVDVLREVLLGLLADDATLEPRDILVMCPDIETYAPLIVADFGLGDIVHGAHPAHQLRVRLADRALIQTNPLLVVAAKLLTLAGSRVTATEVLDFAHLHPVRARFAFTDDDLETITRWVQQANIRWGFDQEHRAPFGIPFIQNTWRFGLDRVLAGVAMSDDSKDWLGVTLPLDDVGSNSVELAGRLAEYVARLQHAVESLRGVRPLADWLAALQDGVAVLTLTTGDEGWQISQLQREFGDVLTTAGPHAGTGMRLPDITALLDRHLSGRPTRANFRTGTLTVCTMVPMRSVPHRVVCLVGLDDTVFPRIGVVDGDDALARDPMTGERDVRSEDRQLLLDAICAASDKLVITYTGANEYSGHPRPPAVPLAELLDALDRTTGEPVRERILVRHPLQPFDIRNVTPGALGVPGEPFTFDNSVLAAASIVRGQRPEQPDLLARPLAAPAPDDVTLTDLLKFFANPVKGFFTALDVTLPWEVDGVEDAMPVEIDNLQQWTVGQRLLTDMLAGMDPERAGQAEWRRGSLPPGRLGWRTAGELRDQAVELARAALAHRSGAPQAYDVDIDLGGGRRLTGTVPEVFGTRLLEVTFSKLDAQHLLRAWIPMLALTAAAPGRWSAVCIGRQRRRTGVIERMLGTPQEDPVVVLRELVAIYDAGRREPIPLPIKTSHAWAVARISGQDPRGEAWSKWRYERDDPAIERVWGRDPGLDPLLTPVRPGEEADGETTRLGAYAARLWAPLLRAEDGA